MTTSNPVPGKPGPEFPTPRKAAMYSLMFGPGAGQFLVGRKLRGSLFLAIFLVSLLQMVYEVTRVAMKHWVVLSHHATPDAIQAFAREALSTDAGPLANLVVILWIISIIDAWVMAYALGKRENTEDGIRNTEGSAEISSNAGSRTDCCSSACSCQNDRAEIDAEPDDEEPAEPK